MKKFLLALCILMVMSLGAGCSKVDPGHVGVLVNMTGSDKGVDHTVVETGWFFKSPTQTLYEFPVFQQQVVWSKSPHEGKKPIDESITFQDKDGLSLNSDVGMSFSIDKTKVSNLFVKYRRGVDEIADIYLRNIVREAFIMAASTKGVDTIYGTGKKAMMDEVTASVRVQVKEFGIIVDNVFILGDMRLPPQVMEAINGKMAATQKAEMAENQKREAIAEAQKTIEKARGEADALMLKATAEANANTLVSKSLTPALVQYKAIEKWHGELPKVTGGATPLISLGDLSKP